MVLITHPGTNLLDEFFVYRLIKSFIMSIRYMDKYEKFYFLPEKRRKRT